MQTTQPPAQTYSDDDEIDLRQLVGVLWRQKGLIAGIGLLGAALGLGASLVSTKYVTEGLFLTPQVSAVNLKRYESVLSNGARLRQYLQATDQAATSDGQLLTTLSEAPTRLQDALRPEFAFTERDQKAFGVRVDGEGHGEIIGARIQFAHEQPTGGTPVTLLGEYVRDTVIRIDMEATMLARCSEFRTREQELRNAQIENDFAIHQEEARLANLRAIIARSPDTSTMDNRQIVSLEKGSERFLAPAAQLIASEIQIAEMKLADVQRERERAASTLKRDYYCQAQQTLGQPITGRAFLDELANIQNTAFKDQDRAIDIVEQTFNELEVERENWVSNYVSSMRFIASPEGTETKQRKPGLALGVVLGGMLGGMAGVMLALIRGWWRGDGDEMTADSKREKAGV